MDLKAQLAKELNDILEPIRKAMKTKKQLIKKAYS